MGFGTYLGNGFKALGFSKEAIIGIREDPSSFTYSLILTTIYAVLAGIIVGLFGMFFGVGVIAGVIAAVVVFILTFISAGITHLLARAFGGPASIVDYYSVLLAVGFALSIVSIPTYLFYLIPILGTLVSLAFTIYTICVYTVAIRETYSLSTGKAFLVFIIPGLVVVILCIAMLAYFGVLSPNVFTPQPKFVPPTA